jgi:polysaccharide biosynthesis transport protein
MNDNSDSRSGNGTPVGPERTPYTKDHVLTDGGYGYNYNAYEGSHSDEGSVSLVSVWRALVYRKWIVLGVFLAVFALGVYQARKIKPVYVSEAAIEVQKSLPSSANINDIFAFFGQFDVYFQTQMLALKDRRTAEAYLVRTKQLPPRAASETAAPPTDGATQMSGDHQTDAKRAALDEERKRSSLINNVLGRLSVSTVQGTQLIEVKLTAERPETAQDTLRGYLETFIELDRERRGQLAAGMKTLLRAEMDEAEKQLRKSEQELQDFTAKHGLLSPNRAADQISSFLDRASQNFMQQRDKRLQLEALDRVKETYLPGQSQDQYLQNLRSQLAQLKSEYASMEALYSPDYFKLVLMRTRIRSLEGTIEDLQKSTLSSMLGAAKESELLAGESYEKTKQEAMKRSPVAAQYEILKKVMEANGQMYVALLQRYKTAALDQGAMGHNVSLFTPPGLPLAPLQASKKRLLGIAALLGLLGGIAVAMALEKLDNRVRTTDELERALRVPILGVVPKTELARRRKNKSEPPDSMIEFVPFLVPLSQLADALRVIENATESLLPTDSSAMICVSSALPLEGKTFISVSMGTVVAGENKRVLVIDGDMRRPRVQKLFENATDGPGLSDLLAGDCEDLRETIRRSHVPGLYYMSAGAIPDNPVALLKSPRILDILEECKKNFDMVILDAPPFMGMADASILARYADGLILVTRQGHTPVDVLRKAQESIQAGRVRLLGIVLNMVYRDSGEYDYYHSKYSYRYNRKKIA